MEEKYFVLAIKLPVETDFCPPLADSRWCMYALSGLLSAVVLSASEEHLGMAKLHGATGSAWNFVPWHLQLLFINFTALESSNRN